jgi:hypothetical protein
MDFVGLRTKPGWILVHPLRICTKTKTSALWPYSASELYRPKDRRLLANSVLTFADRECRVVSADSSCGRILGFLDRRYYFFQVAISKFQLPNCTQEAEWSPSQTHYFSENLVEPGVEPGPLYLYPGNLITRTHRRSTFFYLTYINSARTSQETQYTLYIRCVAWNSDH